MRLKLINKTLYRTKDLRRFLLAGMTAKGVGDRRINIVYGKGEACSGWAMVGEDGHNGYTLQLSLPGPTWAANKIRNGRAPIDYLKLAQVLEHELDHTLGLNHGEMIDWWELSPLWQTDLTIAWVPPQKVHVKALRSAAIEKREAHARVMLKKAETRLKRAKTIRLKWAKKVDYYDRRNQ